MDWTLKNLLNKQIDIDDSKFLLSTNYAFQALSLSL